MNKYTICCTVEQTRKALELGAPIEFEQTFRYNWVEGRREPYPDIAVDKNGEPILIYPTAEQMLGWLEDGLFEEVHIEQDIDGMWSYTIYGNGNDLFGISNLYPSRKEATIAAIDAALEYLKNRKAIKL